MGISAMNVAYIHGMMTLLETWRGWMATNTMSVRQPCPEGEIGMKYEFFAGSYGGPQEENIVRFSLDGQTGNITKRYGCKGIENPSWLTLHPGKDILYAVEELTPEGNLRAFGIEEEGLRPLAALSTKGADPCHICLDEKEEHLLTANYTSGSISLYRLDKNGIPIKMTDFIQHEKESESVPTERGRNPIRQESPHVHFSGVMGQRIFMVDLGLDKVFVYDGDDVSGSLRDTGRYLAFPTGAGPRHLAFHPRASVIYAACELDNKLAVFREREGEYALESMLSTLPESYRGENTAAAIRIWNDLLMVSNRGHDSIAVYSLREDGSAALEQIIPTGGKVPRDFAVMGEYVVIANQGSDEITVLRMNPETKLLEQTGISVPMSRPTCICPVSP